MNNDDHLLTLKLDAYIKGQLSDVEQQAFEKELETDAALADRLRTQRAELVLLDMIAEEDLRQKVRKWSTQMGDNDNNPPRQWWRDPLSILAFLSGIVVLFFLFYPKKTTTDAAIQVPSKIEKSDTTQAARGKGQEAKPETQSPQPQRGALPTQNPELKTQNPQLPTQDPKPPIATIQQAAIRKDLLAYAEDIDRTAERGNDANAPLPTSSGSAISKSVQFIQNQNFTSARNQLVGVSPQAVHYADAQFLLATIDYLQNKPKAAAATFKTLSNMDGYIRKEQATYYWAASLLADGKVNEAKKILTLIATDAEHPKHDAAMALLKSL